MPLIEQLLYDAKLKTDANSKKIENALKDQQVEQPVLEIVLGKMLETSSLTQHTFNALMKHITILCYDVQLWSGVNANNFNELSFRETPIMSFVDQVDKF